MKDISPVLFAIALLTLDWLGYVEGFIGAQNVVAFVTIGLGLLFLCGFKSDAEIAEMAKRDPGPSDLLWLVRALNLSTIGVLIWHGAWWSGVAFTFAIVVSVSTHLRVVKAREAAAQEGGAA